jgi:hypothetical protein
MTYSEIKLYEACKGFAGEIKKHFTPQDIYDFEFSNHECGYVGDDCEAMRIVSSIFSKQEIKQIKRNI